ncbi:preprotein translocase subunit SecG [Pedobacter metabolipauper]|uniref:Protein-export membrane protein SecG n=1 Tax=Pedobacter metabolipauper TaxID=425513 RepID=A0A4R6SU85_9SPHI|nr:preprotein translocase subunit SecG [Pedobacter metabolipauper]TDQ09260.1 preprotein translocase subunit SecG [Pedobacter metabolipauper]
MLTFLIILLIIICIALALFVLVQNPKGGGLATGGAGSNMFGVQRTGDVLEKGTWVLLALIVVITLTITTVAKSGGSSAAGDSQMQELLDKTATPSPIGNGTAPANAPAPANSPAPTTDTTKK